MALAERTWERVGERKRDRARLIESAELNKSQSTESILPVTSRESEKIKGIQQKSH